MSKYIKGGKGLRCFTQEKDHGFKIYIPGHHDLFEGWGNNMGTYLLILSLG